jgi:hypothetical protein
MGLSDISSPGRPSMGTGFTVYLITDEQFQALKEAQTPLTSDLMAAIASQDVGQFRGFTDSNPNDAKGILLERYRKRLIEIGSVDEDV